MSKISVAIHQPNFFPWIGYFDKIAKSDVFILLDDVQLPKKGGTWSNRVKLLGTNNEEKWLTAPIVRQYSGVRNINEVSFDHNKPWRESILSTIKSYYGKSPFYAEIMPILNDLILYPEDNIALYNTYIVYSISKLLGIPKSRFIKSSNIKYEGHSNEMLASLVKAVGGSVYVYGGGSDSYQENEVFLRAQVHLQPQNFQHPNYTQMKNKNFVSGLSIIDALMNIGMEEVISFLKIPKVP